MTRCKTVAGVAGIALAASASLALAAQPQGLYSADQLLDAGVYSHGAEHRLIGEIDDIILDSQMRPRSFVVEANDRFGIDGKSHVVPVDQVNVETLAGDRATEPEYRVTLKTGADQLAGYPVYDDSWWTAAQARAGGAWAQTKDSAGDALDRLKQGATDMLDRTRWAVNEATADSSDTANDATDSAGDTADDAAN